MNCNHKYYYKFKLGYLRIIYSESTIKEISVTRDKTEIDSYSNPLLKEIIKQFDQYFKGNRKVFDLPISLKGTKFQEKVWKALLDIPYGETRTYKDIATEIDNPKACRAVGGANNKNPIIIICPCHRVIGKKGKLVGYNGGLDIKEYLLNLEHSFLK